MKKRTVLQFITLVLCIIFSCNTLEAQNRNQPNGQQTGGSGTSKGGHGGSGGRGSGQFGGRGSGQSGGRGSGQSGKNNQLYPTKDKINDYYQNKLKDTNSNKGSKKDPRQGKNRKDNTTNVSASSSRSSSDSCLVVQVKNDKPEYYASIVRKNGWFVGIGKPLTEDQASHLGTYYKLSRKNKAGNWTFIEAFDGYGDPTTPNVSISYLVDLNAEWDSGINSDWTEKLQSVCKWAILSDVSGETAIQELAMDPDSSTVFIFHLTKNGEREYLGSYTDKWNLPIFLRSDGSGRHENCASRVLITRDERGFDTLIKYIDEKGAPQKNKDGAYMSKREFDIDGHQTQEASLNILGERMIDDWGNCGWIDTYWQGHKVEAQYLDNYGLPIRMPNLKSESENVYGYRFYPDKYGRDTVITYIDYNGKPDVNNYGVHKIRKVYNEHGQILKESYYDINDNLCSGNEENVSQIFYQYDDRGHMVLREYKDKENNYVTVNDDYCKQEAVYQEDTWTHITEYLPDESLNGNLVKSYEFIKDEKGNTINKFYNSKYMKIDSVDSKQRPTLTAWYDLEGNPTDENGGFHQHITTYDDEHGVKIEEWIDQNGTPAYSDYGRNYSKEITFTDSVNHSITTYQYQDSSATCVYRRILDTKSGNIIQQYDLTNYGELARVGWWNSLHYICNVDYSINGNLSSISGRNEFGEPTYIRTLGSKEEAYYIYDEQNNRNYDETGKEIPSEEMTDFLKQCPRVYCIEVTDTAVAFPLGLKNGDIIISYGNWTASKDLISDMNNFYLETILQSHSPKDITLLRHHPEEKSSEIVKCFLPAGKTSELGFYPHKIYYTKKETDRLIKTCANYGVLLSPAVIRGDTTILLAVQQKGSVTGTPFYYSKTNINKDAGILLYAKVDDDVWSIKNGLDIDAETGDINMFSNYYSKAIFILTHDLNDICSLSDNNYNYGGLELIPMKVSNSYYERIREFYALHSEEIPTHYSLEDYRSMSNPEIKVKRLNGKWNIIANLTETMTADLTLEFDKKNRARVLMLLKLQSDEIQLEYIYQSTPKWSLNGVCLDFDFNNSNATCETTKVVATQELDEETMIAFRDLAEDIREQLQEDFDISLVFDNEYLIVKSLTKQELTVLDGDGEERVLTKVK